MEVDRLRKLIREEIHKAFQEEVRDILVEAVEIASKPDRTSSRGNVRNVPKDFSRYGDLSTLLEDTAQNMNQDDYMNVLGGGPSVVQTEKPVLEENSDEGYGEDFQGIDALPDFAKRAGEVFKKSMTIKPNVV